MNLSAYEEFSEKLKALAHPVRLRIALALAEEDHAVCELCEILSISQATISQHLSILRNKGVVAGKRKGTSITYRLYSQSIKLLLEMIRDSLEEFTKKSRSTRRRNIARA